MEKTCTKCGVTRPISEFYQKQRNKDGYASSCKPCANEAVKSWESRNPDKLRERTYRWRAKYPEKHQKIARRSQLKIMYNITPEFFDALLEKQGGKCAICGTIEPGTRWDSFCIDHDHSCCPGNRRTCGKCIRGLLCGNCNTMLGMANDRPEVFHAALRYLGGESVG